MHSSAAILESAPYWLPLMFLVVYLLMRLGSWLATRRGARPTPERLMIACPAFLVLLLMGVLANPGSYPDSQRAKEEQRQSETSESLRRDLDRALKESRATRAMLKSLLHTGWLIALIGLCALPSKACPPKSTP